MRAVPALGPPRRTARVVACLAPTLAALASFLGSAHATPGHPSAGAQDRVGPFLSAAATFAGGSATRSSCTRPGSAAGSPGIAAGCCAPTKAGGRLRNLGRRLADERGSVDGYPELGEAIGRNGLVVRSGSVRMRSFSYRGPR